MSTRNSVPSSRSINEHNTTGNGAENLYENYRDPLMHNNDRSSFSRTVSLGLESPGLGGSASTAMTKPESVHHAKKPQPLPKSKLISKSSCVRDAVQSFERASTKAKPNYVGETVMKFQGSQQSSINAISAKASLIRSRSSTISGLSNSDSKVGTSISQKADVVVKEEGSVPQEISVIRDDSIPKPQIISVMKPSIAVKQLSTSQPPSCKKPVDDVGINKTKPPIRNQVFSKSIPASSKTANQANNSVEFPIHSRSVTNKNQNKTNLPVDSIRPPIGSSSVSNNNAYFDDSNIYEEAAKVQVVQLPSDERRTDISNNQRSTYTNTNNLDEEPLYEDAMVVRKSIVNSSSKTNGARKPSLLQRQKADDTETCLYEEASAVRFSSLKEAKAPNLNSNIEAKSSSCASEMIGVGHKNTSNDETAIYEAAMPVYLPNAAKQTSTEESLYDSAIPVALSKLQQAKPNFSPSNKLNNASSSRVYNEENIYEEAAPVVLPSKTTKSPALFQDGEFLSDSTEDEEGFDSENQTMLLSIRRSSRNLLYLCRNDTILAKQKVEHDAKRMSNNFMAKHASGADAIIEEENIDLDGVQDDTFIGSIKDEKMRMWVATNILESEMEYVENLELLLRYQIYLRQNNKGSLSPNDFDTMFGLLMEFILLHREFVGKLKPKVVNWSEEQEVAIIYKELVVMEFPKALEYLMNYQKALTIYQQRCGQTFQQFLQSNNDIHKKDLSLEDLLHKPVVQLQRSNLMLHDLIRHTPPSHPDYIELRNIRKLAGGYLNEFSGNSGNQSQRSLVRKGVVIELKGNSRKLRQIFLFTDALVCARQTSNRFQQYEVCWYIQLSELQLEHKFSSQEEKRAAVLRQQENESLQRQRIQLRADYKAELRRLQTEADTGGEGFASETGIKLLQNRNLDKIRKKLLHVDEQLVVQSAYLQLKLSDSRTSHTLLLSSDYERNNWKDAIDGLLSKLLARDSVKLTLSDVQNLINSQKGLKPASSLSDDECLLEEERLSGCLSVTIHRLQGLSNVELGTFCSVEIDSFGHFSLRAKTNVCKSAACKWNEDFDIDLEGAQTLHILCYQIASKTDYLLGQCSLAFQKSWLDEDFREKSISLGNGLLLTLSLKFISSDQLTLKRRSVTPDGTSNVFGIDLSNLVKREKSKVPMVITSCVEELERRGLREVGLYRVSGLTEHVEKLKKAFNKNCLGAVGLLKETDSNVLTSLIKLFFRELPEVLFTDEHYNAFVDGLGLVDPFSREKFMINVLKELPSANYHTIIYFLRHLVRLARQCEHNKMTLPSLATVLGPTLLRPSTVKSKKTSTPATLFMDSFNDASIQSSVLLFYLNFMSSGQLDTVSVTTA